LTVADINSVALSLPGHGRALSPTAGEGLQADTLGRGVLALALCCSSADNEAEGGQDEKKLVEKVLRDPRQDAPAHQTPKTMSGATERLKRRVSRVIMSRPTQKGTFRALRMRNSQEKVTSEGRRRRPALRIMTSLFSTSSAFPRPPRLQGPCLCPCLPSCPFPSPASRAFPSWYSPREPGTESRPPPLP